MAFPTRKYTQDIALLVMANHRLVSATTTCLGQLSASGIFAISTKTSYYGCCATRELVSRKLPTGSGKSSRTLLMRLSVTRIGTTPLDDCRRKSEWLVRIVDYTAMGEEAVTRLFDELKSTMGIGGDACSLSYTKARATPMP